MGFHCLGQNVVDRHLTVHVLNADVGPHLQDVSDDCLGPHLSSVVQRCVVQFVSVVDDTPDLGCDGATAWIVVGSGQNVETFLVVVRVVGFLDE